MPKYTPKSILMQADIWQYIGKLTLPYLRVGYKANNTQKLSTMNWYIFTRDDYTDEVVMNLRKQHGTHDEDHNPHKLPDGNEVYLWTVSFDDIQAMVNGKKVRNLKFIIYRENESGTVSEWELPRRNSDDTKLSLLLIPMSDDAKQYADDYETATALCREYTSPAKNSVVLAPWTQLGEILIDNAEDIDGLRKSFKSLYTMLARGSFDRILLAKNGDIDRISSGMEKVILFARLLNIPITTARGSDGIKNDLAQLVKK